MTSPEQHLARAMGYTLDTVYTVCGEYSSVKRRMDDMCQRQEQIRRMVLALAH